MMFIVSRFACFCRAPPRALLPDTFVYFCRDVSIYRFLPPRFRRRRAERRRAKAIFASLHVLLRAFDVVFFTPFSFA